MTKKRRQKAAKKKQDETKGATGGQKTTRVTMSYNKRGASKTC